MSLFKTIEHLSGRVLELEKTIINNGCSECGHLSTNFLNTSSI